MNEKLIQIVRDVANYIQANEGDIDVTSGSGYIVQTLWYRFHHTVSRDEPFEFMADMEGRGEFVTWCSTLTGADLLKTGLSEHEIMELLS